jgi:hypothetical protein
MSFFLQSLTNRVIKDLMLTWIHEFLGTYCDYLLAPIFYHSSCDGYALVFIFTVMELCDTFATYKLYFSFTFAGLLYRNYLFSLFKSNLTLLGRNNLVRGGENPLLGSKDLPF